jgi:hypothetical protein
MHLRSKKRSKQHQLLIDWESQGNEVYYVAPIFHEQQQLNQAYLKRQILQKSVYFRPSNIGPLPDDDEHHIAFQAFGTAFLLSEPQEIPPPSNFEIFSERLVTRLFRNNERTVIDSTQRLLPELIELYRLNRRELPMEEQSIYQFLDRFSDPLQQVAFFARILFDCNYYIVQQRVIDIQIETDN